MSYTTNGPSIAVVGAGSIGGVTAALLAKAGNDVELVCKHEWLAEKVRQTGIAVRGKLGELTIAMPAVAEIGELSGKKDIVFLATKAQDMMEPVRELLPHLHERSVVVSLQNGVCIDALAEVFGRERVVGCVVGWGSTFHEDGSIEVTATGSYVIGRPDGSSDETLKLVQRLLAGILPTKISANIYGALYSKLMINACINSVGAVTGLPIGGMLRARSVPPVFQAIVREANQVAAAAKITIEPYSGQFRLYRLLTATGPFAAAFRGLFVGVVNLLGYGTVRSSTLQSIERGRPTEIDWLNGYIVELGAKHGVATPANERIVALVKEIEQGKRRMGLSNLVGFV